MGGMGRERREGERKGMEGGKGTQKRSGRRGEDKVVGKGRKERGWEKGRRSKRRGKVASLLLGMDAPAEQYITCDLGSM